MLVTSTGASKSVSQLIEQFKKTEKSETAGVVGNKSGVSTEASKSVKQFVEQFEGSKTATKSEQALAKAFGNHSHAQSSCSNQSAGMAQQSASQSTLQSNSFEQKSKAH